MRDHALKNENEYVFETCINQHVFLLLRRAVHAGGLQSLDLRILGSLLSSMSEYSEIRFPIAYGMRCELVLARTTKATNSEHRSYVVKFEEDAQIHHGGVWTTHIPGFAVA